MTRQNFKIPWGQFGGVGTNALLWVCFGSFLSNMVCPWWWVGANCKALMIHSASVQSYVLPRDKYKKKYGYKYRDKCKKKYGYKYRDRDKCQNKYTLWFQTCSRECFPRMDLVRKGFSPPSISFLIRFNLFYFNFNSKLYCKGFSHSSNAFLIKLHCLILDFNCTL